MSDIDYRALRERVRKERRARRTIKHPICLDAALYDEWAELKQQERQETIDRIGEEDGSPDPTLRAGELPTSAKLELLEARIREASIVGLFDIPDPELQGKRNAQLSKMPDDWAEREAYGQNIAAETIVAAFDHFVDADGHPIPAERFGLEDLKELMADWSHGQLFGLATEITEKSREVPELPLSVRSSLLHPHSDATSS